MKLTGQTRKWSVPFSLRTVTESARRNTCIWGSLFVNFFPCGLKFPWSAPDGFRIETPEMLGRDSFASPD